MNPEDLDFKLVDTSIKGFSLLQWGFDERGFPKRSIQIETSIGRYFLIMHRIYNAVNKVGGLKKHEKTS